MGMGLHQLSRLALFLTLVAAGPSVLGPSVLGQEATAPSRSAQKGASSSPEPSAPVRAPGEEGNAPADAGRPADAPPPNGIPPVLLTADHRALCRVHVGNRLPPVQLPRLGGATTDLATLVGKRATIVLFWRPDRWMARTALGDLSALAEGHGAESVSVVGVAVGVPAGSIQSQLADARAKFPQLLDTQGTAFAQVGSAALPRIFVLDHQGKIVWFDIEYSQSTHRELLRTIEVLITVSAPG